MDYKALSTMYTYAELYLEKRIATANSEESREKYKEEMEEITDLFMELNRNKTARKKQRGSFSSEVCPNGKFKRYVGR